MSQRKRRQQSRKKEYPTKKDVVYFECEASTERNYLQKFHQIIKVLDVDVVFDYGNKSASQNPMQCVQKLVNKKRYSQRGDLFIAICDVDDFDKTSKVGEKSVLQKAIELAKSKGITLLISNICFEQWLEFHRSEKQYLRGDVKVKEELGKLLMKDRKFIKSNIKSAYKRAKKLDNIEDDYPSGYGSRVWRLLDVLEEQYQVLTALNKK